MSKFIEGVKQTEFAWSEGLYDRSNDKPAGGRNLIWYKKNVFPKIEQYLLELKGKTVMDIGCGNGRLNDILKNYFTNIICVEPNQDIASVYKYPNVIQEKCFFHQIKSTADVVFMIASFKAMYEYYENYLFEKLKDIVNINGFVFIEFHTGYDNAFPKNAGLNWFRMGNLNIDALTRKHFEIINIVTTQESVPQEIYSFKFNIYNACVVLQRKETEEEKFIKNAKDIPLIDPIFMKKTILNNFFGNCQNENVLEVSQKNVFSLSFLPRSTNIVVSDKYVNDMESVDDSFYDVVFVNNSLSNIVMRVGLNFIDLICKKIKDGGKLIMLVTREQSSKLSLYSSLENNFKTIKFNLIKNNDGLIVIEAVK